MTAIVISGGQMSGVNVRKQVPCVRVRVLALSEVVRPGRRRNGSLRIGAVHDSFQTSAVVRAEHSICLPPTASQASYRSLPDTHLPVYWFNEIKL